MTFSSEIKQEIISSIIYKDDSKIELFGILDSLDISNNFIVTNNKFLKKRIIELLEKLYYIKNIGKDIILSEDIIKDWKDNNIVNDYYIKGFFLGCGSINTPTKNYHMEFIIKNNRILKKISNFFEENNIKYNISNNKVYIKNMESILNLLAIFKVYNSYLKLENIIVYKDFKNNITRQVNCEAYNISKVIKASIDHIEDIKYIKSMNKFDELPEKLKEIAEIRLENSDYSLRELGELLTPKLGKSGVNHRLNKIHEYAEKLRQLKSEKMEEI